MTAMVASLFVNRKPLVLISAGGGAAAVGVRDVGWRKTEDGG